MESIYHRLDISRGLALSVSKGFTLIEMMIVAAIITIIAAVIFSGQGGFNNSVLLSSATYDIALSMRDAQIYGLGTRATLNSSNAGYGLDFKSATPSSYILFADSMPASGGLGSCHTPPTLNGVPAPNAPNAYPGDCVYNGVGGIDALVSTYSLGSGMKVSNLCTYNGASWSCSASCGSASPCSVNLTQLDMIFVRPNGIPFISTNGVYVPGITLACLTITAPSNTASRVITLTSFGQIAVDARPTCP